jgi:hypothetical protein
MALPGGAAPRLEAGSGNQRSPCRKRGHCDERGLKGYSIERGQNENDSREHKDKPAARFNPRNALLARRHGIEFSGMRLVYRKVPTLDEEKTLGRPARCRLFVEAVKHG